MMKRLDRMLAHKINSLMKEEMEGNGEEVGVSNDKYYLRADNF